MARASSIPKLDPSAMPADLKLVILFGSQAKGCASPSSDWDLGVLFMPGINDPLRDCRMDFPLAQALGVNSDAVDVVDLERASYLLQGVVAQEGLPLFEREAGSFASFASRAHRQWADWSLRRQRLNPSKTGDQ
jgi:predicted nucleotidyltransferase